jgi:uncharacterized protein (TIGR03083 family)
MLRSAPPVDVLSLMEEERTELVRLLRPLGDDDAARKTACDPWTVKDIAAHLLGDDISALSRNRDGHDDPTIDASPDDWDGFRAWLDDSNQRWVDAASFFSLGVLCDLLESTGHLTLEFFRSLESGALGEPVSWVSNDPAPNWLSVGREFTERWIHQQQIRDALDKPGLNGPSFVTPTLGILVRSLPRAYDGCHAPAGTTVEVSVAGRGGGAWAVRRGGSSWDLLEGREREVDAKVVLGQDTMWRFLSRNVSPATARARAELEGPTELTGPFFEAVSAIVRTE